MSSVLTQPLVCSLFPWGPVVTWSELAQVQGGPVGARCPSGPWASAHSIDAEVELWGDPESPLTQRKRLTA